MMRPPNSLGESDDLWLFHPLQWNPPCSRMPPVQLWCLSTRSCAVLDHTPVGRWKPSAELRSLNRVGHMDVLLNFCTISDAFTLITLFFTLDRPVVMAFFNGMALGPQLNNMPRGPGGPRSVNPRYDDWCVTKTQLIEIDCTAKSAKCSSFNSWFSEGWKDDFFLGMEIFTFLLSELGASLKKYLGDDIRVQVAKSWPLHQVPLTKSTCFEFFGDQAGAFRK